jgi:phosphoenolpyruvate carboxylase
MPQFRARHRRARLAGASIATEPDALARDSELLSHVLHEVLVEQAGEELRLLEITGEPALLADSPALQRRPSHRNPWIDPLSLLQVELLAPARAGRGEAREPLLATIIGITAEMRNTG